MPRKKEKKKRSNKRRRGRGKAAGHSTLSLEGDEKHLQAESMNRRACLIHDQPLSSEGLSGLVRLAKNIKTWS